MSKVFTPFSVIIGVLAGKLAGGLFQFVWGKVAPHEAPEPEHKKVPYGQLVLALAVEGAITRIVRGFTDHGLRHVWERSLGEWPGEEKPSAE